MLNDEALHSGAREDMSKTSGVDEAALLSTRFAAGAIDAAIAAILGGVAAKGAAMLLAALGISQAANEWLDRLVPLAVYLAYSGLLPVCLGQRTIGQRCLGLRLVAVDGGPLTPAEGLFRCLAVIAAALPLGAGLLIGLAGQRQPFQDLLCSSQVLRS